MKIKSMTNVMTQFRSEKKKNITARIRDDSYLLYSARIEKYSLFLQFQSSFSMQRLFRFLFEYFCFLLFVNRFYCFYQVERLLHAKHTRNVFVRCLFKLVFLPASLFITMAVHSNIYDCWMVCQSGKIKNQVLFIIIVYYTDNFMPSVVRFCFSSLPF